MTFRSGACPDIVSRREWNASNPVSVKGLRQNPPPYVVIHHSATSLCTSTEKCKKAVKSFQNHHFKLGWEDIGYNFLIGGDGKIYEGRGWGIHGAHVPAYNARSIGICLIGNFQIDDLPDIQLDALKNLIACAVEGEKIINNYHLIGHRQGSSTLCPGDKLFDEIKKWPKFDSSPA